MPSRKYYDVFIAVHHAEPLDYQKYRHAALYLRPSDTKGTTLYCHVVGAVKAFQFETMTNYDVFNSQSLLKLIPVGRTAIALTTQEARALMRSMNVDNDDYEFNCHVWVQGALYQLSQLGYITNDEYLQGVDDMVAATLENNEDS